MVKKDENFGEWVATTEFPNRKIVIRQYEKGFIIKNKRENTEVRRERPQGTTPEMMAEIIGEFIK
jgi:hypothetical protein